MSYRSRPTPEQDARDGIAAGAVELLEIEHDEVRALALLERADLGVAAQRSHPADHTRQERREADLLESVEPVVACGPVRAETDRDARAPQPRDLRDAGAELQVRRGAVGHGRLRRLQDLDL